MDRTQVLILVTTVLALSGGCKIQPVNGNVIPGPGHEAHVREAERIPSEPFAAPETGKETGPKTGSAGELGAAAREVLKYLPLGPTGGSSIPGLRPGDLYEDEIPVTDRWRIGFPSWERGSQTDSPFDMGDWWDPYHQNWLKGDYAVPGTQNWFLNVEATSLTRFEQRRVPTPSSVFPRASGNGDFFGEQEQSLVEELLLVSADLFHGETSFKPVDFRLFVRGAFNWNKSRAEENTALFADPAKGTTRYDNHAALQQAFIETTLASVNDKYDVIQLRLGTQLFNADFKGFLFFDEALGARLFGTADDQRWQWNLGIFRRWEKDTNSGLNTFDSVKQNVFIANLYRQDILEYLVPRWKSRTWSHGLQSQLLFAYFTDDESVRYDENGFLVRPRAVGFPTPTKRSVAYFGWNNEGHIGRLNITSSFYEAHGYEEFNEIAGRPTSVDARMAALELSVDVDWMRFRMQGFYQSGDRNPLDGQAEGFDAVFDNPVFAGGEFGFWNRNTIRLTGSGVGLVQRNSLLNSLRSSKDQGAPSYVNPGLLLGGIGYDAQLTPHLKVITNASYLRFADTESVEYVLNQDAIGKEIGYDLSVGVLWRPFLTDNMIVKSGISALVPGGGFRDIYTAKTLYAYFAELIVTW